MRSGMIINDIADSTHEAGPVPVLRDARAALLAKRRASEVCKPGSMETATMAAHQDHSWILALRSLLWAEFFQSIVLQWVSRFESQKFAEGVWVDMYRAKALEVRERSWGNREWVRGICGYTT